MAKQHFSIGRTSLSPDQLSVGNTAAIAGNLAKRAILIPTVKLKQVNAEAVGEENKHGYIPEQEYFADNNDGTSLLGTPVYGTMKIKRPEYSEFIYNKKEKKYVDTPVNLSKGNQQVKDEDYLYIEGCVLEVTQNKNIVTTTISGQNGTDKEYINLGDFDIKMHGFFSTTTPDIYPAYEVKTLTEYLNAPKPLEISNTFLNDYFGISSLVVMKYDFKQTKGMRNVQHFTVSFKSDLPFETIEIDNV
mgnify:CR=1 FL=1|tara:strand:+ start:10057 stop:10794 length:738 start_codon:yes stop_codon:yes gene_type:complete